MTLADDVLRHRSFRPSSEFKTGEQRYERPIVDYLSKTSPCRASCPNGHDISLALFLIAQGRPDLADLVFHEEGPFPAITGRVCYHPCESGCNRAQYDEPLAIAQLERFAADDGRGIAPAVAVQHDTPVAVVGSGPTGLSCAYHLRLLGYPVTVFEANAHPGGALRYGIPAYRLPRTVLDREIARLKALGIDFRCSVRIGDTVDFRRLREQFAAIFLGIGLARPRRLSVPGAEGEGIVSALHLLRRAGDGTAIDLGGSVVVIGGGDSAMDAARVARRQGAKEVTIVYRRSLEAMPAHPDEVRAAREEGISIAAGWTPLKVLRSNGCLALVTGRAVAALSDEQDPTLAGNRQSVRQFRAETIVYAIGQELDRSAVPDGLGDGGRVVVGEWGATALPGVFSGGDAIGTYNVVHALSGGKRAAIGIDLYLQGRDLPNLSARIGLGGSAVSIQSYLALIGGHVLPAKNQVVGFSALNLNYFKKSARAALPTLSPAERSAGFAEANAALEEPVAVQEAMRCFHCGFCTMCGNCFTFCPDASVVQQLDWGFMIDLDHCKGCGICVHECPRSAMSMVVEEES